MKLFLNTIVFTLMLTLSSCAGLHRHAKSDCCAKQADHSCCKEKSSCTKDGKCKADKSCCKNACQSCDGKESCAKGSCDLKKDCSDGSCDLKKKA